MIYELAKICFLLLLNMIELWDHGHTDVNKKDWNVFFQFLLIFLPDKTNNTDNI